MIPIANGWMLHVDESPEWLFFHLDKTGAAADPAPPLAEQIWEVAKSRDKVRFVIDLSVNVALSSYLVGQLVLIHKRSHQVGGVTRICDFSVTNYQVLKIMRLDDRFPNYSSRGDAVAGHRPVSVS